MKLYVKNLHEFNKSKLNQLYKREKNITMIYSLKGIYEIQKDEIYEINIKDEEIECVQIKEYECILDKSIIKFGKNQNQIPFDHILVNIKKKIYKLNEDSLVEFIVENVNNNIKDYYFNVKDNLNTYEIKNEIYTFLSDINNRII